MRGLTTRTLSRWAARALHFMTPQGFMQTNNPLIPYQHQWELGHAIQSNGPLAQVWKWRRALSWIGLCARIEQMWLR